VIRAIPHGAQLAALISTDERYLKAEGLSLAIIKRAYPSMATPMTCRPSSAPRTGGPLEGAWSAAREVRSPEKFGNDPEKHRDFSAVTHVPRRQGIPPFLSCIRGHPDTTAQALRLATC